MAASSTPLSWPVVNDLAQPNPASASHAALRVGFLGPPGTFTEQALLTQPDLAAAELVPYPTMADVLRATETGEVDLGFVAIENSIEGTVNVTSDTLAFDVDVLIQREVVIPIQQHLMGVPGSVLAAIEEVVSIPHATAQARQFLHRELPSVRTRAANSTAEAARLVAEAGDPKVAAIGNALAASIYDLEVLAEDIEDHPENETRFVAVAPSVVPAPTGHDKTSVVVFQHEDAARQPARHPPAVRGTVHQPDQPAVPAHQEGLGRLLLLDRPRRSRGRRPGGRLPQGAARHRPRGEVPRLVPGRG